MEDLSKRWGSPRATIAHTYHNNDYGYVFHGAAVVLDLLEYADISPVDCKKLKILDYGCGTGRIARIFALTGAKVWGYDPYDECIKESLKEGEKVSSFLKTPILLTSDFLAISETFDIVYCVNVLEHLVADLFETAILNIESKIKENGKCYLWIGSKSNSHWLTTIGIPHDNTKQSIIILEGIKENSTVKYKPIYGK
jgi:2-polyprenyl-3-methyl-5-hydroxy-6-metoxy-1,4-benzoquinol methylase